MPQKNIAKQIANTFKKPISEKEFNAGRIKLPAIPSDESGRPILSVNAYLLHEDIENSYVTYVTQDNLIFSLPKGEVVKYR